MGAKTFDEILDELATVRVERDDLQRQLNAMMNSDSLVSFVAKELAKKQKMQAMFAPQRKDYKVDAGLSYEIDESV